MNRSFLYRRVVFQMTHCLLTGISGVMIARGALIKPWLFQEIKEQKHLDPSSKERFEMLQKFCNYGK